MINRNTLYDLVYNKADKLFKEYNPCKIKCKKNNISCIMHSVGRPNNKLCCYSCEKHWSDKGCTIKCLYCKLYLCDAARSKYTKNTIFRKRLYKFKSETR